VQRLQVVGAGGEIVEAVGVEQDGDRVGCVALVDRDQALVELLDGGGVFGAKLIESALGRIEL
jgi:hypothetical protein